MDWPLFAYGAEGWGDELLRGLVVTVLLAVVSYALGTAIGLAAGLTLASGPRLLRPLVAAYGTVFRSVPELLILFLVYFGTAMAIRGALGALGIDVRLSLNAFTAGVVALSLVHGAYTAEVFRGALNSVPTGLREAAMALGMRPRLAFARVVLPVALRYAFPGLANLWMVMIKNTPLVSAIGLPDLIGQANTAGQNTKAYFAFFTAVLAIYLTISALSMTVQLRAERRLARHLPAEG